MAVGFKFFKNMTQRKNALGTKLESVFMEGQGKARKLKGPWKTAESRVSGRWKVKVEPTTMGGLNRVTAQNM